MDEAKYRTAERELWESIGLEPREVRVPLAVAGVEVRVQIVGAGPPVLFIHGGPNSGATWAPILPAFEGFTSYLVDRPGTGLSDPYPIGEGELYEFGSRFVDDLLDVLDIDRAHVVASSFGGFVALCSAAATPGRFDRMVQMACPAFAPGMQTPRFMKLMGIGPIRWLMNTLPPNERVGDSILRQIGHGPSLDAGRIPQVFKDWYLALQKYTDTMKNEGAMIAQAVSFRKGFDVSLTLPTSIIEAVEAPTLFLWGEDDAFGGRGVAESLVASMRDARLEMLPESGHLPWLDDAEGIGRRTAAFLRTG
ncbi:MAG TPA: alpha/beta hydrolase [Acidimicrobiia bacterium]|nr:alpha/beta hydrolase [Acidimicrobiia bacterium]